jgi:hypothetical protein
MRFSVQKAIITGMIGTNDPTKSNPMRMDIDDSTEQKLSSKRGIIVARKNTILQLSLLKQDM